MSTDDQPAPNPTGLLDGVHVVIVHSRTTAGGHRWTRRPYFNLPAAQRALGRATMRGDKAHLVPYRLAPVPGTTSPETAP